MDKYSGKKLDGRYEIHELIGVGGMAYVYRCTDTIDDREVAVKILKDEYLNNDEFIRRFKNESKAIAMLSHPNIVKVYDVSFGDVIQYIVMEYIDGITLKEYIGQQGVLDWREALHLTTQILRALQHAHDRGIVHRDIKPQNIMLLQDGTIKVTDFGIARLSDTATKTMTEKAIGSVHYIAPEQAKGSKTDGKSDLYSIGVMLYEMITGKLPFEAESAVSVALMQLQSTPSMPRDINPAIPIGLEQITVHAMQKNPKDRYQTALDMLGDSERFRLNPNVRFDYKHFVDSEPTKFVDNFKKKKSQPETKADNEAEDLPEKKQRSNSYYAIRSVIVSAVAMILIFLIVFIVKGCTGGGSKDVEITDFVGMTIEEALENNPHRFVFEYKPKYESGKEENLVLAQDPVAGSKLVKSGSTITLTVNTQDIDQQIMDYKNIPYKDVVDSLKGQNLNPQVVQVYDDLIPSGNVCNTFPTAGVTVDIGSVVYVYVSQGEYKEKIPVPKYTVYKEDSIPADYLTNFNVEFQYDDESLEPAGTIVKQTPLQGSMVDKGSTVKLSVSSGKGSESNVTVALNMPMGLTEAVNLTVSIDGKIDKSYTKEVYPSTSTHTLTFTGSSTKTIMVMLDDVQYCKYVIDFSTLNVETEYYNYVVETPEPVVTEPQAPETDVVPEESQAEE